MAIVNAFDRYKHFDELDSPLSTAAGVLTPAQRRAACLANLFVSGDTISLPGNITIPNLAASTTSGIGTVSGNTVAAESGSGDWHNTQLTCTAFSLGDTGDNASLAIGNKFYTFPAGEILVQDLIVAGLFSAAVSNTAQTPEIGVGSVIGSGAVATLSTTLEDYIDGGAAGGVVGSSTTLPDLLGTTTVLKSILETRHGGIWIKTSGGLSHDLFLNAAVAWADVTAAAPLLFTGKIGFRWRKVT